MREANNAVRNLKMGKRSDSFREDRHWVIDQIGKAEVVYSEDDNGMEVCIKASNVGRKDGDWLRDGDELSRPCLDRFCHIGRSIIVVVLRQLRLMQVQSVWISEVN